MLNFNVNILILIFEHKVTVMILDEVTFLTINIIM
jgi:hypothetical protein